ncbi:MAG: UDP-N-acetylmuramoyl-L-alanyl-D-glutamate--2,6-diaminopimelate ligase [Opitutus sp.]|nr:UDP-N-acetylmuramoyl-L-alanyl-D-glutamate--2,6-diaminopimelate ligase [Opitutus sp.]
MIGYLAQNYALIHAFAPRPARRTRHESLAFKRVFKMAPQLSEYFHEGEIMAVKGPLDRPISGLAMDSRRVLPGNLFFALPGLRADGAMFIDEAVSRGAVAVVTPKLPAHAPGGATFIQVADARASLAAVAQRYYKFPDRDLSVVGVAGTSGQTTVTHLLKHLLSGDQRVGLLGAISYDLGARSVPSYRTTPESLDIFGLMAQMRDAGCRHAVMEVSSHGINQQRVAGLNFGAAVFTNLTRDPGGPAPALDAGFAAIGRLFTGGTGPAPKVAVVHLDDPQGEKLAAKISADVPGARLVTFGEDPRALVRAENITLHAKHTTFRLVWPAPRGAGGPGGVMDLTSPLIGRDNVSHLLAAIATAWGLGRDPVVFLARLRAFPGVPGRMERIEEGQPFNVLVDYAHTPATLRSALELLRPITPGRLHVVFGCGGNRDRTQRPLMVRAAQATADLAFATADNPRTERLGQIFEDMRAGVTAPEKITWTENRREAIRLALEACQPGDCLLVAGKGHESSQECADTVFPFDDRQMVRELLASHKLKR